MAGRANRSAAGTPPPVAMGAVELRDRLVSGALRAEELAEIAIARIAAREPGIGAWAFFDPDFVRHQARALDAHRAAGRPLGALHGLPVGLKDIVDTARVPTENGCALDAGRVPLHDAWVTRRLKQQGAVIMGKTVTTELAFMHPGRTRNPHHPGHTPGGSSSGSAAAVADGMVPLALGTQTGGSVIRPAAFCGITGFKPTFGAIPRTGILTQSPTLDTVGVFAADPAGAALLAGALFGHDPADPATTPAPLPALLDTALAPPPVTPVFAFVQLPGWDEADPELHAAFDELKAALGEQVFEVRLPEPFGEAAARRARINFAEMAHHYRRYAASEISGRTRAALDEGAAVAARDYLDALDWQGRYAAALEEILARCDAILCPSAPGPAPQGLESTGDPIFNGLFTYAGLPAVSLPLLTAASGLPMGVQLAGPRGGDGRLLRTARWLYEKLGTPEDTA